MILELREHGDNLRRLTDIVSDLDTEFDRQLYDELKEEKYDDEPDESEFCVNITVGQLRKLTIAALAAQAICAALAQSQPPAASDADEGGTDA